MAFFLTYKARRRGVGQNGLQLLSLPFYRESGFASGWWEMAKKPEAAVSNFAAGVRGFSAMGCSAFLCAFAPLR
jgi:hypothetical protein